MYAVLHLLLRNGNTSGQIDRISILDGLAATQNEEGKKSSQRHEQKKNEESLGFTASNWTKDRNLIFGLWEGIAVNGALSCGKRNGETINFSFFLASNICVRIILACPNDRSSPTIHSTIHFFAFLRGFGAVSRNNITRPSAPFFPSFFKFMFGM